MSLFDSKITKYIIKGTGFPGSVLRRDRIEIFDGNKNLIGKMDMTGIITRKISLLNSSDTAVLTATREILILAFVSRKYKVKDEKNNQVGRLKSKWPFKKGYVKFWNYEYVMMDPNGNQVLKMDSIVKERRPWSIDSHGSFEINEPNGKKIAKVTTEDEDRKTELGKLEMSFTWTMDIFESSFDRKVLLGFLISIFCSDYDVNYRSGLFP